MDINMKLIINGDDFGHTRGVNFGIADAFRQGILRSATIMANRPAFLHAIEIAKENPNLGVGIHLVLSSGQPLGANYRTIVQQDGMFYRPDSMLGTLSEECADAFDSFEVETEFRLQIEAVLAQGIRPTHLDSHHFVHMLPSILPVVLRLADHYGFPMRITNRNMIPEAFRYIKSSSTFSYDFYDDGATLQNIVHILEENKDTDILEVMSHPAYVDKALIDTTSYVLQRARELEVLTTPRLMDYINENHIELVNYSII